MSRHRYPLQALLKDDVKAALGLAVSATPLFFVGNISVTIFFIFLALTILFLVFAVRTALRHMTVIEISDMGVRASGPLGATIAWEDLRDVRLRYYSTRRDRERGWMDIRLKGGRHTLRIDSAIEGFEHIVRRTTDFAPHHGIELSAATRANLKSMGLGGPRAHPPAGTADLGNKIVGGR
jgi:hypothetical protein